MAERTSGFVVFVEKTPAMAAHHKTRVRFAKARPWVRLPPFFDAEASRAFAARLHTTARAGYAVEWVAEDAGNRGHWRPLVQLADGAVVEVDERIADEERALVRAASLANTARQDRITSSPAEAGETCAKWWGRYFDHREGKGQTSVKDSRGRVTKWILPVIGTRPMAAVTRAECEEVVRRLDEAVAAGKIEADTAGKAWGEVTSAFNYAKSAKPHTKLRVRDDNPTDGVQGPDAGITKDKPILYPSEVLALLSCERVPLFRRRVYAVAIFIGARRGELAALLPGDVDVAHERIQIAKQVSAKTRKVTQTKTRRVRKFDLEAEIVPLLKLLVDAPEGLHGGRLLRVPPPEDCAELIRKDLQTAGVTRAELFVEDDPARLPLRFHHLRDTCLTWMAYRGDDPMRIQWRGGHTDFKTTQGYIAAGANLGAKFGTPFPPLPPSLLVQPSEADDVTLPSDARADDAEAPGPNSDHQKDESPENLDSPGDSWRPQRDLNPCYRRERPMS